MINWRANVGLKWEPIIMKELHPPTNPVPDPKKKKKKKKKERIAWIFQ